MMVLNLVPVSGTDLFEGAVKQILTDSVCPTRSAFGASRTFICIGSCAVVTPPSVAVPFLLLTSHEQKHSEQNRPANRRQTQACTELSRSADSPRDRGDVLQGNFRSHWNATRHSDVEASASPWRASPLPSQSGGERRCCDKFPTRTAEVRGSADYPRTRAIIDSHAGSSSNSAAINFVSVSAQF